MKPLTCLFVYVQHRKPYHYTHEAICTHTYLEGDDHGLGIPPAPLTEAAVQQVAALGQEGQRQVVGHGGGELEVAGHQSAGLDPDVPQHQGDGLGDGNTAGRRTVTQPL